MAVAVASAVLLQGCIDPKDYESEPVRVETPKGIVTCQLYTLNRVTWDRAIHRPENMTVAEADRVCVAEGTRLAGKG